MIASLLLAAALHLPTCVPGDRTPDERLWGYSNGRVYCEKLWGNYWRDYSPPPPRVKTKPVKTREPRELAPKDYDWIARHAG